MLLHKSVEHDSRVRREARSLASAGHEVTVVHLPGERHAEAIRLDGFRAVCATPRAWVRRALPFHAYRLAFLAAFVRAAVRSGPDAVHAHDAPMLAPGLVAARLSRAELVYDSHELATGVPYRERFWARMVAALERIALPRCAVVITVSDGIADRLRERYGLRERPVVLRNVPDVEASAEGVAGLRERLGIGSAPLVLHQGALAPRRGCETLVEAVAQVPGAQLVFLGDAWPGYAGAMERFVREVGVGERVHFVPSVPVSELLCHTREADIGVSLLSDDCDNHRLALPNKVFEYIAAGVPVVVSDLPELQRLVEEHGVGWTADSSDPSNLAEAISTALAEGNGRREALTRAAERLRWSREADRLLAAYGRIGGAGGARVRALVLVRNSVTYDARVLREGRLLQELGYDTTIVGSVSTAEPAREATLAGVPVIRLAPGALPGRRRWRRNGSGASISAGLAPRAHTPKGCDVKRSVRRLLVTLDWYRRGLAQVRRSRPTLVHCNDYNTMWIGVAAKLGGARVIYDSHELWPDRNLRPEPRGWLLLCEALFVRAADQVITTSPGYADVLARRYRIPRPTVVRNVPEPGRPGRTSANGSRRAVYFGAITRHRGLEDAIELLDRVPELRLRLVGPEAWSFRTDLLEAARRLGVAARVEFAGPVPPDRAADVLADADLGLALIQPACLSYELTLPNKLFEYVHAGLPVVGTNLPVIRTFIDDYGVGVTVRPGDGADLAEKVQALLDPETNAVFRARVRQAALGLSWSAERRLLESAYREAGSDAA